MSIERGHIPQKKWGQNFLRSRDAARRIVEAVQPAEGEMIFEIGPGEGVLTERLLALGRPVTAVEIDPRLASRLESRFAEADFTLIRGDATEVEFPQQPFRAVGNLPYNVATPILRRTVASPFVRRAVFMVQKEVADRLVAGPSMEAYGYLTLAVGIYADPRVLLTLEPGSFFPPPKVKSSVVVLDPVDRGLAAGTSAVLATISQSFRMRRKKLVNNLIGFQGLERSSALAAIESAGLDPGCRAEELSLEQFDRLAVAIGSRDVGELRS